MGHNGCDGSQASGPWAIGSGYRFTPLLRANPGGVLITPMAAGTQDHPLKGGGVSHPYLRPICGLGCPVQSHSKTGTVL